MKVIRLILTNVSHQHRSKSNQIVKSLPINLSQLKSFYSTEIQTLVEELRAVTGEGNSLWQIYNQSKEDKSQRINSCGILISKRLHVAERRGSKGVSGKRKSLRVPLQVCCWLTVREYRVLLHMKVIPIQQL